jgi:hypothetical protein
MFPATIPLFADDGGQPADFRGVVFPEWAFPPARSYEADYRAECRRGYAAMAGSRVVITGLARNVAGILPTTMRRIENLTRCFADHRIVVYENDSTDETRGQLLAWAAADRRVHTVSEQPGDPVNPATRCLHRAARMARYRRRCQELVLAEYGRFDAVIIIDLDILGGWSTDGIAHTFGQQDWDFVGANGIIYRRHGLRVNDARQYDTWALRLDDRLDATLDGVYRSAPLYLTLMQRISAPFFGVAVLFLLAAAVLVLARRRLPPPVLQPPGRPGGAVITMVRQFRAVLAQPWARVVLVVVFCEGAVVYGPFAFIAAHLHQRFGLPLSTVGGLVMGYALGGLVFALGAQVMVARLGEVWLVRGGSWRTSATVTGHNWAESCVVELRDGGSPTDPTNGVALCGACHSRKTARARAERMARPT